MIVTYLAGAYLATGTAMVSGAAIMSADLRRAITATWWLVAVLVVAWPVALSSRWRQ